MAPLDVIKRAPKWAWVTTAGVGIGAIGIKLWNGRDKPVEEQTTDSQVGVDPNAYGDGSGYVGGGYGGMPGVVVPPVILPGQSETGDPGLTLLPYFENLIGGFESLYSPVAEAMLSQYEKSSDIIGNIAQGQFQVATAGPAPAPLAANPTPVSAAPPAPAVPVNPCAGHGAYVNFTPGRGCYKVVCASGKGDAAKGRWHYYESGAKFHVSGVC